MGPDEEKKTKPVWHRIVQNITGDGNIQAGGDVNIVDHVSPPPVASVSDADRHDGAGDDANENFPCMKDGSLSHDIIVKLKQTIVDDSEESKEFIDGLPKAELHCHIGGILSINDQRKVGREIVKQWKDNDMEGYLDFRDKFWSELERDVIDSTINESRLYGQSRDVAGFSHFNEPPSEVEDYKTKAAAMILSEPSFEDEQLEMALFPSFSDRYRNRVALANIASDQFLYSLPGELMGSTVLKWNPNPKGARAVIAAYARGITHYVRDNNIRYFELRLSPTKYRSTSEEGEQFLKDLIGELNDSMGYENYDYEFKFLISGDRRQFIDQQKGKEFWEFFSQCMIRWNRHSYLQDYIVGIDIAGAESSGDLPDYVRKGIGKVMLNSGGRLKLTLHAGEQDNLDSLEESLELRPSRVGHALKLISDSNHYEFMKAHRISIELCPTSNIEVHGYHRPSTERGQGTRGHQPNYPLQNFLENGMNITISTDNPFISRTDLGREYIEASLMTKSRLSQYQIIQFIYNSISVSFLKEDSKKERMDEMNQLLEEYIRSYFRL